MLVADIVTLLIPLWIVLGLLVLLGIVALLGRIQNGRYLRPVINVISKVPLFRRWLQKASTAALERSNPELASAMKKVEKMQRTGVLRDPNRAQAAMTQLTAQERRALLQVQEEQGAMAPETTNRQIRRQMEKAKRDGQRRR
jgi:hypothetical protein